MTELDAILKVLKANRNTIPRKTLLTIRGQALSGDLKGARKGLDRALKGGDHGNIFTERQGADPRMDQAKL